MFLCHNLSELCNEMVSQAHKTTKSMTHVCLFCQNTIKPVLNKESSTFMNRFNESISKKAINQVIANIKKASI